MGIIIKDGSTNNLAEVDSNNNLKVNLPLILSGSGYAVAVAEVDNGEFTGSKLLRQFDVDYDYRLRSSNDRIVWQDNFSHAILNTSRYLGVTSTMTISMGGGFLNLNAGNATATGNVARVQTYRTFPIYMTYPLYVDLKIKFSAAFQTSSFIEFGLGYAATTLTPTDGVFFRVAGGSLWGVRNYGGYEQSTKIDFIPTIGAVDQYSITITIDGVKFWINNSLMGLIENPVDIPNPVRSASLPLLLRNYNLGVPTVAVQLNIAQVSISIGDLKMDKDWASSMVGNGQGSISAPDGQTVAQLANSTNSTAPALSSLSNTTPTYAATILGGQFYFNAAAASENDYALFGYLNPAGTSAIAGKNLYVTGVRIETVNSGATIATTSTLMQWGVGVGCTAVSLNTADSNGSGTRGPRRIPIGVQSFAVGTPSGGSADRPIDVKFHSPLIVEQGTYFHVILKMPIATATAGQAFRGTCMISGYFE